MEFLPEKKNLHKGRLFVGGVPIKFEEKTLKDYFGTFGQLGYFKLAKNKKTKESLGFGFLEFKEEESWMKVLSTKHKINGREIDVKPFRKGSEISAQAADLKRRKLFVKNLHPSCNSQRLYSLFSCYGNVDKAYVLYDHKTGCSRGFGFVEYLHEEDLARALEQRINIDGKLIECSRVFLKQEVKDKVHIPEGNPKSISNNTKPYKAINNKNKSSRSKLLTNETTSVPDLATQGSLGSIVGEWEKELSEYKATAIHPSSGTPKKVSEEPSLWPAAAYSNISPALAGQLSYPEETETFAWRHNDPYQPEPRDYEYQGPFGQESENLRYVHSVQRDDQSYYSARFQSVEIPRVWNPAAWSTPYYQTHCQNTDIHSVVQRTDSVSGSFRQRSYYRMF